jgi:XRE family transcriptional regulator, regulator of sulfur utilization
MTEPFPDTGALGRAVRAIREERRINQVELAAKTGFTQAWISHVERGQRNPSWINVVRLAEGLGVGVAELANRAEAEPRASA